jgi:hypothetical protein
MTFFAVSKETGSEVMGGSRKMFEFRLISRTRITGNLIEESRPRNTIALEGVLKSYRGRDPTKVETGCIPL